MLNLNDSEPGHFHEASENGSRLGRVAGPRCDWIGINASGGKPAFLNPELVVVEP